MASDGDHILQFQAELGLNKFEDLRPIDLSSIDSEDGTFRITTQTESRELVVAIQQLGLIHPPILKQYDTRYRIISGFRRIAACRLIGWSKVPAFILNPDAPEGTCALIAIADNSFQRPLNLIEISRSLNLLSCFFKKEKMQLKFAVLLGLSEHRTHIKKIKRIFHLPEPIQDAILSETISLAVAMDLAAAMDSAELEPDTGVELVKLFEQLGIGINKQRQLMVLLREVALRENINVQQVLGHKAMRKILDSSELDRVQKSRQIKSYLQQRRYPTITRTGKDFEAQVKKLKLGNSATLAPPRDFEGTTYTLTLRFDSHADLLDHQSKLDRIVQSDGLKRFLDGIKK
ncbi:MAG: ParB N-terminal domain-containing protein [Deltaproteobacteria bacterium]|jgi:ParB/RepB/Spo0J family partition protein|nr:ParB N-terminal domain-containing protein [Deltaproteobacteria bacterium]